MLQGLHNRLHATFAGFVHEIVFLVVLLPCRRVQVTAHQQCATGAGAELRFKSPHEFPYFSVCFLRGRPVLPLAASVFESNRDDAAGNGAANLLSSRHAGAESAGQLEGCILLQTELIAKRIEDRLGAVVPGQKFLHGNIASCFHRLSLLNDQYRSSEVTHRRQGWWNRYSTKQSGFGNSLWHRAVTKADSRISIKDYRQNKNLMGGFTSAVSEGRVPRAPIFQASQGVV